MNDIPAVTEDNGGADVVGEQVMRLAHMNGGEGISLGQNMYQYTNSCRVFWKKDKAMVVLVLKKRKVLTRAQTGYDGIPLRNMIQNQTAGEPQVSKGRYGAVMGYRSREKAQCGPLITKNVAGVALLVLRPYRVRSHAVRRPA